MPSSVNINGVNRVRPAVYATIDASALGGTSVGTGNICIVGSFPSFQQGVRTQFSNARALKEYDATDRELALLSKLAFAPSLDVSGASTCSFLNVQGNTQASLTINDNSGNASLILKSKVWGIRGNRTSVSIENANTTQVNVTVLRDGITETFTGLESGDFAEIYYDESVSGRSVDVYAWDDIYQNQIKLEQKQVTTFSGGTFTVDVTGLHSNQFVVFSLGSTSSADVDITVVGTALDGSALTEAFTIVSGDTTGQTLNRFASITSITGTDNGTYSGGTTARVDYVLETSDFSTIKEMIDTLGQLAGITATYTGAKSVPASEGDLINVLGATASNKAVIRADLNAIVEGLSASTLITAERASGARDTIPQSTSGTLSDMLTGGSASSVSLSDWTNNLELIESDNIQILVPWTTDINQIKEVEKHLDKAALAGSERNAWIASPANTSLSNINSTYVIPLNSRNMAIVGQKVKISDPEGKERTLDPIYLALISAGMQAGTPVATPLTRKRPDVLDVVSPWDANRDAAEAIRKGIVSLSYGSQGWRIERSVTTYVADDNPIYSEVSANESVNTSVRDLRLAVDHLIGQANTGLTANRVKSLIEARLNNQVRDGIIKAFKDLVLVDLGDTLRVDYTVAAVEPLNFITITATVARF